jgi:DNA-binding transcriptional ArsR family regulator
MPKEPKKDSSATQLAKVLAHPLRVRILETMERRERRHIELKGRKKKDLESVEQQERTDGPGISPNMLSSELDEPLGNVSYHMKELLKFDCVELVKTEPRRGAVEHFYRSTGKAVSGTLDEGQVTIPAAHAKLVGSAIHDLLGETDGTMENGVTDALGRTEAERQELREVGVALLQAAA